jgi:hypothetical protein
MSVARYVPCLRWKKGEYQAVSLLTHEAKAAIAPLIEVPEMGFDFETRENHKTIDEHLAKIDERIGRNWGRAPCMVDLHLLDARFRMANRDHPLTNVFSRLRAVGTQPIPVVAATSDAKYLAATRKIAAEDKRGVCLRIGIEEADGQNLKGRMDSMLGDIGVGPSQCDLVLDLGAPSFEPLDDFAGLVEALIGGLPYLKRWRSLTLLGTSFPSTLAGMPAGLTVLPRNEWRLFRLLLGRPSIHQARVPDFGDYGISHPNVLQGDMRWLKPSAAIRYTVNDGWLIAKGTNLRVSGAHRQFHRLSADIVGSRHYSGADYSAGDKRIKECASGKGGPGNLTTWRFVGTNHHLEKVVRDLATQRGTGGNT